MYKYYWLAVEADEYELPLVVCDTAEELGKMFGVTKNSVIDSVGKNKSGKISGRKFMKVRREEWTTTE